MFVLDLPVIVSFTRKVDQKGGIISSEYCEIVIPSGALDKEVDITITLLDKLIVQTPFLHKIKVSFK